jgi:Asp-tRNA(Asn)/Glu-tRNA(Gln) amidotransferase B subunit
MDESALVSLLDQLIADNPDAFEKLKAGDGKIMGFFTGQVMKATQGKADGKRVAALLQERARS